MCAMTYADCLEELIASNEIRDAPLSPGFTPGLLTHFNTRGEVHRLQGRGAFFTPCLDEFQKTPGALAYSFRAGKAVVSTPLWLAAEVLRDQCGVLVAFGDPMPIA
jgi:hypothetical protein